MKVMISFPPLVGKGCPMLGQNRQFQWFTNSCYIYPMVPASAATLLKTNGFDVVWSDFIAEEKTYTEFLKHIEEEKPDVIVIETKTPVVKRHWKIINDLKKLKSNLITVLVGDHVTALPEESMRNSPVDFIITGGYYDFLLLNLVDILANNRQLSSGLEAGIWYRENGHIKNTGNFVPIHDLNKLPFIDRDLTKWKLYSEKNGNYKKIQGTYTIAGRDCWYHKCGFCSWTTLYPKYTVRSYENLLDEIGILIDKYNIKEIMDDTGTFPTGKWLVEFCNGMIERGYNKKVTIDCNMRFGILEEYDYKLMKKAGFRLLLFGLESANQKTLNKLNKGIKKEDIIDGCKLAKKAGLYPHLTVMFGYPWETFEDIIETVNLVRFLLRNGYAYTLQSTIVIPYPGTPLFEECKRENLLTTLDWDKYDMDKPVMKTNIVPEKLNEAVRKVYSIAFDPKFLLHKLLSIRDFYDVKYFLRGAKAVFGHLKDFIR